MKKTLLLFFMLCLIGIQGGFAEGVNVSTKKYILVVSGDGSVASETAASTWFSSMYGDNGQVLTVSQLADAETTIDATANQVIWVHIDQGANQAPNWTMTGINSKLEAYSKAGGSLLLTLHAIDLLGTTNGIGRINDIYRPRHTGHGNNGDMNGIKTNQSGTTGDNSGHSIYAGLSGDKTFNLLTDNNDKDNWSEIVWDFNADIHALSDNKLSDYQTKTNSKVLGTWSHVGDDAVGGVIEFYPTGAFTGTSIAIGQGCYAWDRSSHWSSSSDATTNLTYNIQKLTANCIAYLDAQNTNKTAVDPSTYSNSKYVMVLKAEYTHGGANDGLTDDEKAAADWFWTNYVNVSDATTSYPKGEIITTSELGRTVNITPAITKVVWAHLDGTYTSDVTTAQGYTTTAYNATAIEALQAYVLDGGNLYASKYATTLVASIGRIPSEYQPNRVNEVRDDMKGINPQIGCRTDGPLQLFDHQYHAVFDGLQNTERDSHISYNFLNTNSSAGTGLMWAFNPMIKGNNADPYQLVDFEIMTNSIVLGAWEHVVDYYCGGIVEFLPILNPTGSADAFKGRVIANGLGGYDWNNNDKTENVSKLTENTLEYLAEPKLRKVGYLLTRDLTSEEAAVAESFEKYAVAVDQDDEKTALDWFYKTLVSTGEGAVLQPKDLPDLDPSEFTTIWVHVDRDGTAAEFANWGGLNNTNNVTMLVRYAKNGGNMLLTKHALQLVADNYKWRNSAADSYSQTTITSMERCWDAYPIVVERGEGMKADNNDEWVINPVIGQGRRSDGSGYVRYLQDGDTYKHATVTTPIHDNFANHLYYNMAISKDKYPIGTIEGDQVSYDVYAILGAQEKGNYKEDHNCGWLFDVNNNNDQSETNYITGYEEGGEIKHNFEGDNNCTVLGQWGHKTAMDNAMIVDFNPTGAWNANAWEGHILCIGLGAYEWQPSNADGTADSEATNPFYDNISQLTLNALNVLENDMGDADTKTIEYGGVKYTCWDNGAQHVATILSADADLQAYDLTETNGQISNGQITYNNGTPEDESDDQSYDITSIGLGAFTSCTSLAYADLMAFKGVVPEDVKNRFPAWTLIYLPKEKYATTLATCPIKGENIVNTLTDDTKVSEKLKIYDNEVVSGNYVYHLFANKYEFEANAVEFNRSFSAVKSTIIMPFAMTSEETAEFGKFYAFDKVSGNDVRFAAVSATEAYKPYLVEPKAAGTIISITGERTIGTIDANPTFSDGKYTLAPEYPFTWYTSGDENTNGGNFIGEFRPQKFTAAKEKGIYAYKSDGTFKTGTVYADPFRAYLKIKGVTSGKVFNATFFDDFAPTGISNVSSDENPNTTDKAYYTLQGVRVSKPSAGIYIHNGKKIVVKK